MNNYSTIRLRLWLPLMILGAVTLLQLFSTLYQRRQIEHELENSSLNILRGQLGRLEFRLQYLLNNGQQGLAVDEIAQLGVDTHVNAAALIDDSGKVMQATRLAWLGHNSTEVMPEFNPSIISTAQSRHQPSITLSADHRRIIAYQPVLLEAAHDQIRATRVGVVLLDYDLAQEKDGLWHNLLQQTLAEWIATLLLLLALQLVLQRWLTRPLQHLTDAVHRFKDGDYTARTELRGSGELADLSSAYNQMREQLADTLSQLEESHENLATTLYSIGDAVIATDCDNRITNMNAVAQSLTGWTQEAAMGQDLTRVFHIIQAHTRKPAENPVKQVLDSGKIVGLANHTVLISRTGEEYHIADSAAPIRRNDGEIAGVVLVFRDISEEYALRATINESEERYRNLFQTMAQGALYLDAQGNIVDANPAAENILGVPQTQLKQSSITDMQWRILHEDGTHFIHDDTPPLIALRTGKPVKDLMMGVYNPLRDSVVWIHINAVPQFRPGEDKPYRVYTIFDDLTERKEAEEKIRTLAFYDVLTKLPNRRLLVDRLNQALASSNRNERYGALLFIDLDNFKVLNDTQGHDVGDMLLIEVAHRLLGSVREQDTVARLGGDEFVVMMENLSEVEQDAAAQSRFVAEKIRDTLNKSYQLRGSNGQISLHHSTPSIGVSLFLNHSDSVDELLKRADVAMYQAKDSGRNAIRFFDPSLQQALEAKAELESWLRHAIPAQLRLHYQMQVDRHGHPTGAEVLLRCEHPQRGLLPPLEFISIAEESGLILPMGLWVLEEACKQLSLWAANPATQTLQIAVNVSARQFRQPDFVEQVSAVLQHTGALPHRLKLELTESMVLGNVDDCIYKMHSLRDLGVSFSLDDFGTGYSSLSYLQRLPLQQIKIDQSFVRNLDHNASDTSGASIVQAIIVMAHAMGLQVIAEGVETTAQHRLLEQYNCHHFQGYLFGRPVPLNEFEQQLRVSGLARNQSR
jgi:diguanylate cyclase (GGDEF)-like protein/PAS domain S-box-containing protein